MTKTADTQQKKMLSVTAAPHPFCTERITAQMPAGESIAAIIRAVMPEGLPAAYIAAYLDGHFIPQENWHVTQPHAGTILTLRAVPRGGGGKNPLRTILSLALVAASPVIAGAVAGALGVTAQATILGINAARVITAGVNILGRLALNAIAPPGQPRFGSGQKESPTLFLQGARNQVVPFGRVPKVLGRHRFVPPMGALPYTETIGNDQYLRMVFVWGYGPLNISDLRIGETPLSEFEGVEIETRYGHADDAPLTLYSRSVMQNDMEVVLRKDDGYVLRTTDTEADEISIDVTLPRGLVRFNGKGGKVASEVRVEVQYSPAGQNEWSAGGDSFKSLDVQTLTLAPVPDSHRYLGKLYTVTRTDRIVMDAASGKLRVLRGDEYKIGRDAKPPALPAVPEGYLTLARVERRSGDTGIIHTDRITDERTDALAASVFETESDFAVTPDTVANRIKIAAGGLKFPGVYISAKQTSAVRRSISFRVPRGKYDVRLRRLTDDSDDDRTFNDTVWSALRTVRYDYPVSMRGLAMTALRIKATDQMNGIVDRFNGIVESIVPDWDGASWTPRATSNPASLFRHILQGNANARPLSDSRIDITRLQEWHAACAAAGREFNAVIDYDTSVREVLQDIAAAGRASPTLTDGKWGIVEDKPQSVPVQHFTPRNTWGFEGRKAFDDIPDGLRVRFINRDKDWAQDERLVFRDGITADTAQRFESITLPGVTHPQQAWRDGRYHLASAILRPETYSFNCDIEHIVCTRGDLVRFTHDVPMFGLTSARIRTLLLDDLDATIVTGAVLDSDIQMEEDKNYSLRVRRADGSSVVFALETESEARDHVVFSTPQQLSTACISAGDLVMFGESGTESVLLVVRAITPQSEMSARLTCVDAAPALHAADTGPVPAWTSQATLPAELKRPPQPEILSQTTDIAGEDGDGEIKCRLRLMLAPHGYQRQLDVRADIRAKDESFYQPAEMTHNGSHVVIHNLTEGEIYDIRLRYMAAGGIFSAPLVIAGYRMDSLGAAPDDVGGLSLNVIGSTGYLSWPPVAGAGISHYTLRFSPVTEGAAWNSAVDLVAKIPASTTSLAVPAAVGSFLIKAVDLLGRASAAPAVAISGIAGLSGYNAVETVEEAPDFDGSHDRTVTADDYLRLEDGETEGVYTFAEPVDLGAVYTSLVTAEIAASGMDRADSSDAWDNNDLIENRDGNADPASWRIRLQLRTTADDPLASPVWTPWQDFSIGEYTARAFECRAILESDTQNVTPVVSALSLHIDMPDRIESGQGVTSASIGTTISYPRSFRTPPAVAITAQNMQSGDYYSLSDMDEDGFTVRFFDAAGIGIVRQFDWVAKGYGLKN